MAKCCAVLLVVLGLSVEALPVHDAPFTELKAKNEAKWSAEDAIVKGKLKTLQKKFNKRPNIIYILSDDIGNYY
jgi:hypothetical protein